MNARALAASASVLRASSYVKSGLSRGHGRKFYGLAGRLLAGRSNGFVDFGGGGGCRGLVTAETPKPMKRFYKEVSVGQANGDVPTSWQVLLDGKAVKTPKGTFLRFPTSEMAEAARDEWESQTEFVRPKTMPITTIACTTLDLVQTDIDACVERMMPYLVTDTVCYEDDQELLAELQKNEWGPLRKWFEERIGVAPLSVARGLAVPAHPEGTLATAEHHLKKRNSWELCALEIATNTSKSLVVATALFDREDMTAKKALRLALLEEFFQIERWGLVEGEHDVTHENALLWLDAARRVAHMSRRGESLE
eukprot:TRINITY_DN55292_c0_g1_i1.p1 TRINITY_DN55292_c0_g1~~TRINITY_DN55292_c0_g1_i1.p1  ORF type:complete len:309 (-),score=45.63 TRINITY_DN55292_c0_g1_i1:68-994(-)